MRNRNVRSAKRKTRPKCLIIERHDWETGGQQQQLQLVLETARRFFGRGDRDRRIHIRVFMPAIASHSAFEKDITISRVYGNRTRRTNGFPEMGSIPSSFVFFEEAGEQNTYNVWWITDKVMIAARYSNWQQGRNTQYGRGRLSTIIPAPVSRSISRL